MFEIDHLKHYANGNNGKISKIYHPSNGAVATVKTRQGANAAASSSSSVAAQELQTVAAEELQDWDISGDDAAHPNLPAKYVKTTPATLLTHVSAAEAGVSSNMGGRRTKGKKRSELSKACGNEGNFPWLRLPNSRSVEINTVETLASTAILTSSLTVPTFNGISFTIASVNDFTSFSNVFDQYRINLIEVLIEPVVSETTTLAQDVGEFISVVDVDDANVPTSYADLCSYTQAVQSRGTQSHYHRWKPTVAVAVYSGAFTSFAATTSMWLDCGSPNIQHYGLKIGSQAVNATQNYFVNVKLHCSWRARH